MPISPTFSRLPRIVSEVADNAEFNQICGTAEIAGFANNADLAVIAETVKGADFVEIFQIGKNAEIDYFAGSVEFAEITELAEPANNANFANNADTAALSEIAETVAFVHNV